MAPCGLFAPVAAAAVVLLLLIISTEAAVEILEYLIVDADRIGVDENGQLLNYTTGDTFAIRYEVHDRQTGSFVGRLRGSCVTVAGTFAQENQCALTMSLTDGSIQLAGPTFIPPGYYDDFSIGNNVIAGGTGLYAGARGYVVETVISGQTFPPISDGKGGIQRGVAFPDVPSKGDAYITNGATMHIIYGDFQSA